ncbi:MAG: hypothetical protein ACK2T5_14950, partial [Anaerolineales bacterium]
ERAQVVRPEPFFAVFGPGDRATVGADHLHAVVLQDAAVVAIAGAVPPPNGHHPANNAGVLPMKLHRSAGSASQFGINVAG